MNCRKWLVAGFVVMGIAVVMSCGQHGGNSEQPKGEEDLSAKKMLQGVWMDEDEGNVAFLVKGDTIYYPDSVSVPAYFCVYADTMVVRGSSEVRYPIVKLAAHLFEFKTQSGDVLKLSKTTDKSFLEPFLHKPATVALNQGKVVKHDTIAIYNDSKYHAYVQVNPTTYKVLKSSFNDDGVAVDNIYYDNIVNVTVYHGAVRLFSHDFRKQDFGGRVPEAFLEQSVLTEVEFRSVDADGVHFVAVIASPDSSASYQVEIIVGFNGKFRLK